MNTKYPCFGTPCHLLSTDTWKNKAWSPANGRRVIQPSYLPWPPASPSPPPSWRPPPPCKPPPPYHSPVPKRLALSLSPKHTPYQVVRPLRREPLNPLPRKDGSSLPAASPRSFSSSSTWHHEASPSQGGYWVKISSGSPGMEHLKEEPHSEIKYSSTISYSETKPYSSPDAPFKFLSSCKPFSSSSIIQHAQYDASVPEFCSKPEAALPHLCHLKVEKDVSPQNFDAKLSTFPATVKQEKTFQDTPNSHDFMLENREEIPFLPLPLLENSVSKNLQENTSPQKGNDPLNCTLENKNAILDQPPPSETHISPLFPKYFAPCNSIDTSDKNAMNVPLPLLEPEIILEMRASPKKSDHSHNPTLGMNKADGSLSPRPSENKVGNILQGSAMARNGRTLCNSLRENQDKSVHRSFFSPENQKRALQQIGFPKKVNDSLILADEGVNGVLHSSQSETEDNFLQGKVSPKKADNNCNIFDNKKMDAWSSPVTSAKDHENISLEKEPTTRAAGSSQCLLENNLDTEDSLLEQLLLLSSDNEEFTFSDLEDELYPGADDDSSLSFDEDLHLDDFNENVEESAMLCLVFEPKLYPANENSFREKSGDENWCQECEDNYSGEFCLALDTDPSDDDDEKKAKEDCSQKEYDFSLDGIRARIEQMREQKKRKLKQIAELTRK